MSELGIFIDESGVFEPKQIKQDNLRELYIVSFLFHDKSTLIDDNLAILDNFLMENNLDLSMPIHTMPLIRQQKPYIELNREQRLKLFNNLFYFMRKLKLKHKTFVCDKNFCSTKQVVKLNLENYVHDMITNNINFFNKFDEIVIYYDKGQNYLTETLKYAFSKSLNNYRFKENVCQNEYRLLQCADMVCTLELIKQRKQNHEYIKAIDKFFVSANNLNKNYLKTYNNLEL